MACPELEELLNEGSEGHAAHCEECHALLAAWAEVDERFDAAFAGICAPKDLAYAVHDRIARELPVRVPSLLPEILDLIGWAAVLALTAIVVPRFTSLLTSILAGLD